MNGPALLRALHDRGLRLLAREGGPLPAAQCAAHLGQPLLARALLAGAGGLLEDADARRVLAGGTPPPEELGTAPLPEPEDPAQWAAALRVLAASFLVGSLPHFGGEGLRQLPELGAAERTRAAANWAAELGGAAADCVWVSAAWGRRWQLRRELPGVQVVALETLQEALAAAWSWTLPELHALLQRPLIVEGHQPAGERLRSLLHLLQPLCELTGWPVLLAPAAQQAWPPQAAPHHSEAMPAPRELAFDVAELAAALPRGRDVLVMMPSRASAARLTATLPGSALLSSSLCRAHLEDRAGALQASSGPLTVVATTLPPPGMRRFDAVWHPQARPEILSEAAELGPLTVMELRDTASPPVWRSAGDGGLLSRVQALEARRDYASLAGELAPRSSTSLPALVPYGAAGELIEHYRRSGRLSTAALRYAAWVTPTEAQRALLRGDAERPGWALIWRGEYHPEYGLAAGLMRELQPD